MGAASPPRIRHLSRGVLENPSRPSLSSAAGRAGSGLRHVRAGPSSAALPRGAAGAPPGHGPAGPGPPALGGTGPRDQAGTLLQAISWAVISMIEVTAEALAGHPFLHGMSHD